MGSLSRQRAFALIELLVVLVIIALLYGAYMGLSRKGGPGGSPSAQKTLAGKALEKAESVECQSNLNQLRQMIQMEVASGGAPPARIDTGATAAISRCPVSGKPYGYDPATGRVWCTTPGHERY